MKTIEITGASYSGIWNNTRAACRCIVIKDDKLLLSYASSTDKYMIPGGGMENGESDGECCAREVAEETGYVVEPSRCMIEITEYFDDWQYVNRYFFGTVTGRAEPKLTEAEKRCRLIPVWLDVKEALKIFSEYGIYAETNEMKKGLYFREYTALTEMLNISET